MVYLFYIYLLHIEQIKQKALPILKDAGVTKSALFGSYVRGDTHDDSDIDILVEYNTVKPRLKQYILSEQLQIL